MKASFSAQQHMRASAAADRIRVRAAALYRGGGPAVPEAEVQSRAAAAATAGARLTPCSCLMAEPPAERISVIWITCAACRTLPQCTTGVYAVLQHAHARECVTLDFLSQRPSLPYKHPTMHIAGLGSLAGA